MRDYKYLIPQQIHGILKKIPDKYNTDTSRMRYLQSIEHNGKIYILNNFYKLKDSDGNDVNTSIEKEDYVLVKQIKRFQDNIIKVYTPKTIEENIPIEDNIKNVWTIKNSGTGEYLFKDNVFYGKDEYGNNEALRSKKHPSDPKKIHDLKSTDGTFYFQEEHNGSSFDVNLTVYKVDDSRNETFFNKQSFKVFIEAKQVERNVTLGNVFYSALPVNVKFVNEDEDEGMFGFVKHIRFKSFILNSRYNRDKVLRGQSLYIYHEENRTGENNKGIVGNNPMFDIHYGEKEYETVSEFLSSIPDNIPSLPKSRFPFNLGEKDNSRSRTLAKIKSYPYCFNEDDARRLTVLRSYKRDTYTGHLWKYYNGMTGLGQTMKTRYLIDRHTILNYSKYPYDSRIDKVFIPPKLNTDSKGRGVVVKEDCLGSKTVACKNILSLYSPSTPGNILVRKRGITGKDANVILNKKKLYGTQLII